MEPASPLALKTEADPTLCFPSLSLFPGPGQTAGRPVGKTLMSMPRVVSKRLAFSAKGAITFLIWPPCASMTVRSTGVARGSRAGMRFCEQRHVERSAEACNDGLRGRRQTAGHSLAQLVRASLQALSRRERIRKRRTAGRQFRGEPPRHEHAGPAGRVPSTQDFEVEVDDCGGPSSTPPDTFKITTTGPTPYMAVGPLVGGNITIHTEGPIS